MISHRKIDKNFLVVQSDPCLSDQDTKNTISVLDKNIF